MIEVIYENRKYEFKEGEGWVSDGIIVPEILNTFLSRKAIADGADPQIFKFIDLSPDKSNSTKKKPKTTKTSSKKQKIISIF